MKSNVVVGSRLKDLSQQIGKINKHLNDVMATNEKIASELSIVKKINSNLENRITALEKLQAKAEQYNRRINVKISSISNDASDNGVEEKVIGICKDSNIVITSNDIEGCHRFPLVRNSTKIFLKIPIYIASYFVFWCFNYVTAIGNAKNTL